MKVIEFSFESYKNIYYIINCTIIDFTITVIKYATFILIDNLMKKKKTGTYAQSHIIVIC